MFLGTCIALTACGTSAPDAGGSASAPTETASSSPTPSADPTPSAPPMQSTLNSVGLASGYQPTAEAPCVTKTFAGMTRNQRAGQVLMVGLPAGAPTRGGSVVTGYQVGGVFLHGRSTIGVGALRSQIDRLQASAKKAYGVPLHIAADQEGGAVQTFSGKGFPRLPTARAQGGWSTSSLRAQTKASATALRKAGITVNLAPVADTVAVADRAANPPIGRYARDYGSTPKGVAVDVATVVRATQDAGVSTAVKHFPGLGRVRVNTDSGTGAVDRLTTDTDPNLAPFTSAIDAATGMVMISSATYPALDSRNIAAFSHRITTDLLRGRLGFTGVAISDDLGAAGAVAAVPVGRRASRFIGSGGDLVLTVQPTQIPAMRKALLVRAAGDPAFARRLDQAVVRVLTSKAQIGLLTCE